MAEPTLFATLAAESETVRWQLADIPWHDLAPEKAPPPLRALVREMAFSEHATFSATQRFLQSFFEDVDFTQWLSIWFYEETRHPHVLMSWLAQLGEPVDDNFVLKGRVSTPFMKSMVGTLVTNIISEITAAHAYTNMANSVQEPVLATLARNISGDEARHAAAFFRFADRRIQAASDPVRAKLDALKVLHFWLNNGHQVTHPINQMIERLEQDAQGAGAAVDFDFAQVQRRVTRMIGLLVDLPLKTSADVESHLRQLTSEAHAQHQANG